MADKIEPETENVIGNPTTSEGAGSNHVTIESTHGQDVPPAGSMSSVSNDRQSNASQEDMERGAGPLEEQVETKSTPSRPQEQSKFSLGGIVSRFREHLSSSSLSTRYKSTPRAQTEDEEPSETSALLPGRPPSSGAGSVREHAPPTDTKSLDPQVRKTTWQEESKILFSSTSQLIGTAFLEYAIINSSVISVGHLGKVELGAASLATVTATITGFIVCQGLVTGLDTMSPQAFGAGHKELVGLQAQRMTYFLWLLTIPIGAIWLSAGAFFKIILPQPEVAELAGTYLRIALFGLPGFALFNVLQIYLQAQGIFSASFAVLLFCAPLHVFMNWLFVWKLKWGFVGAPTAFVITDNLLPLCLILYIIFIDGRQCWGGFSWKAFQNWSPMIRIAIPGLLMVEAEVVAFEILTVAASYISTSHLAAQTVLSLLSATTFQIPFALHVASSARVGSLVGANLVETAQMSIRLIFVAATILGCLNLTFLSTARHIIPCLFTNDPEVIRLVASVLPLCAAFQLFDALATNCSGILQAIGRQNIGGWVNLFCYYVISIPVSFTTAFVLHWDLYGLWAGVAIALGLVAAIEGWFIYTANWDKIVEDARKRNLEG